MVIGETELESDFDQLDGFEINFLRGDEVGLSELKAMVSAKEDLLVACSVTVDAEIRNKILEHVSFDFEIDRTASDLQNPTVLANHLKKAFAQFTKFIEDIDLPTAKLEQALNLSGIAESLIRQELEQLGDQPDNCYWALEEYRLHLQSLLETLVEKSEFKNQDSLGLGTSLFLAEYSMYLRRNRNKLEEDKLHAVNQVPTYYFELDKKVIVESEQIKRSLLASFLVYLEKVEHLSKFDFKEQDETANFHGPLLSQNNIPENWIKSFEDVGMTLEPLVESNELRLGVPLLTSTN